MRTIMQTTQPQTYTPSGCPTMSDDIRALTKALLRAKASFAATGMTGKNREWKYAKLSDIMNAVEGPLRDNNINIYHWVITHDGKMILCTRLLHDESGQYIDDQRYLESEKPGCQSHGSTQSYMRRYAVQALLGICPGEKEDDDGVEEERYIQQRRMSAHKTINKAQVDEMVSLLQNCGNAKMLHEQILTTAGNITDLNFMDNEYFQAAKEYILRNKIPKRKV